MKIIILAGGFGTRISEETGDKPKPMVLIDGKPMLWHIMSIYRKQGFNDFIIATGYKGLMIREWLTTLSKDWQATSVDTGENTQTGGRIKKCIDLYSDTRFLATYGDGLGNIDIHKLIDVHVKSSGLATLTAVRPAARFGRVDLDGNRVRHFGEKIQTDEGWINGGFFVLEKQVGEFILDANEPFERGALPSLADAGMLNAYKHHGFWQPMDTLREKLDLEKLARDTPPLASWNLNAYLYYLWSHWKSWSKSSKRVGSLWKS